MKKWDNGVVSMPVKSCMSCPEKKQIMAKKKLAGKWTTALAAVLCKRTQQMVKLMGIDENCPLPDYEGGEG